LRVTEKDGDITVTGNECARGERHGIHEYREPTRMLTTTVAIRGGVLPRMPVISREEVPKAALGRCLEALYRMELTAPLRCGDIVAKNIAGTGVDVIASRSMSRKEG
jgi:CxxC motif-containing protein